MLPAVIALTLCITLGAVSDVWLRVLVIAQGHVKLRGLPKFDEYGDLSFTKEKQRLDYFAQELTSVPEEPGYIIEYRSRREKRKPLARANRAKDYLVRIKRIDAKRIHVVNGGYHKEFKIELRLGPTGSK